MKNRQTKEITIKLNFGTLKPLAVFLGTLALYAVFVFPVGYIVGGDIGTLSTRIDGFGFVPPLVFSLIGGLSAWYSNKNEKHSIFFSFLIALSVPYLCSLIMLAGSLIPYLYIFMAPAMPVTATVIAIAESLEDSIGYTPGIIVAITMIIMPFAVSLISYFATKR